MALSLYLNNEADDAFDKNKPVNSKVDTSIKNVNFFRIKKNAFLITDKNEKLHFDNQTKVLLIKQMCDVFYTDVIIII